MTDVFCTRSYPLRKQRASLLTCLVMALAAFAALTVTVGFFLMLEAIVIFTALFTRSLYSRAYWLLRFEGDRLYLKDCGSGQAYQVYDVPASDFVFTQSKSQKAQNRCDLKIKDTIFAIYDADQYAEMAQYIAEHFPADQAD